MLSTHEELIRLTQSNKTVSAQEADNLSIMPWRHKSCLSQENNLEAGAWRNPERLPTFHFLIWGDPDLTQKNSPDIR